MAEPALRAMTADEYFAWGERQADRYEYVDGFPVRMMSGANRRHDRITLNLLVGLQNGLRGHPCRGFTADTAVSTVRNRMRRPDAGVEGGTPRDEDYVAADPRAVFEVLSPSTREFDLFGKLEEYRAVATLREIVVIEPNAPEAMLWWRANGDDAWQSRAIAGLGESVELPSLGIGLPMAEIYDGLTFRPRPEIVPGPPDR